MFRFPWLLAALPVLLGTAWWLLRRPPRRRVSSLRAWQGPESGPEAPQAHGTWRERFWWGPELAAWLGVAAFGWALAGPQVPPGTEDQEGRGLALAVVLDRSGSMSVQLDIPGNPSRFEGTKAVLTRFLRRRPQDLMTLIAFARYPETLTPLTQNPEILIDFLDSIPLAFDELEGGTAIGDALVTAGLRLRDGLSGQPGQPGVVLLLTDGNNNAGVSSPEEGARLLKDTGFRLYAIGLGGTGTFQRSGPLGAALMGQSVVLDAPRLTAIAESTGGAYFQADDPTQLETLLGALETGDLAALSQSSQRPRSLDLTGPLLLLLALLAGGPALGAGLWRRADL